MNARKFFGGMGFEKDNNHYIFGLIRNLIRKSVGQVKLRLFKLLGFLLYF